MKNITKHRTMLVTGLLALPAFGVLPITTASHVPYCQQTSGTFHCSSQYELAGDMLTLRVSCDHFEACPPDGHFDFAGVVYDGGRSGDHAANGGDSVRDLPLGKFNETVEVNDLVWGQNTGMFYCQDVDGDALCGEEGEPAVFFCGRTTLGVVDTTKFAWAGYAVVGSLYQGRGCPVSLNQVGGTTGTVSTRLTPAIGSGPGNQGGGFWSEATAEPFALPSPPHVPSDFTSYTIPPVGPAAFNPCNNGGPTSPQEFGWGTGNALHSGGSNYHRYANDNTIGGQDSCLGLAGVASFASCAVGTEVAAAEDGVATALAGPLPGSVPSGGTIILTQTGNVAFGASCGGIAGSGTDGEYDYGSNAAYLNVRTGPGPNGGDGLQGCYGGDCGSNASDGCLADDYTKASAHHGGDTHVVVMDAALGGAVAFTLVSDWARYPYNTIPGQKHCGDGVVEPCLNGVRSGLVRDLSSGNTFAFLAGVAWLVDNPPQSERDLDVWNQVRVGCNLLDYAEVSQRRAFSSLSNDFDPSGSTLADFSAPGGVAYKGGAAGYLLVLVGYDNPGGALNTHANTGIPTLGWVWTY